MTVVSAPPSPHILSRPTSLLYQDNPSFTCPLHELFLNIIFWGDIVGDHCPIPLFFNNSHPPFPNTNSVTTKNCRLFGFNGHEPPLHCQMTAQAHLFFPLYLLSAE